MKTKILALLMLSILLLTACEGTTPDIEVSYYGTNKRVLTITPRHGYVLKDTSVTQQEDGSYVVYFVFHKEAGDGQE